MGRVTNNGYEWEAHGPMDGVRFQNGDSSVTRETSIVRTGNGSLRVASGPTGTGTPYNRILAPSADTTVEMFYRTYVYFGDFPATEGRFARLEATDNSAMLGVDITSGGVVKFKNLVTGGTQIGSDSSPLSLGQWYRIEVRAKAGNPTGEAELRIDGVTVALGTGLNLGTINPQELQIGWPQGGVGNNKVVYFDDGGCNNTNGADENSWLGEGKLVLLRPVSDNAVGTGWTDGDGSGTLFGSLDNTPPIGQATPADGTQIRNAVNTTTGNYDADLQSYEAAGIGAGDTIKLVQLVAAHGEEVSTGTKTGAFQIISNPAQASEEGITFFESPGISTYPLNWGGFRGTPQYNPSVVLSTQPVIRVGKRSGGNRAVGVCAMGLYVEFVPVSPVMSPFGMIMQPL